MKGKCQSEQHQYQGLAIRGAALFFRPIFIQEATMKHQHYLMISCLCTAFGVTPLVHAKDQVSSTVTPSAAASVASTSTPAPAITDTVAATDKDLMRKLAFANLSEIATANLALTKTSNATVKTFAQHMIDDHTKASEELKALAQRKNVALPTAPDPQHAAASKKMALMSGNAFDQIYLHEAGVVDHRSTLQLLQNIGAHAKDTDLKALAQKLTPSVVAHLDMVQKETMGSRHDGASHDSNKGGDTKNPAAK